MKNSILTFVISLFFNLFFLFPHLNGQYFKIFAGPIVSKTKITEVGDNKSYQSPLGSGFIFGVNLGFPLKKFGLGNNEDVNVVAKGLDMGVSFMYRKSTSGTKNPFRNIEFKENLFEARTGVTLTIGRLWLGAGGQVDFKTQFEVTVGRNSKKVKDGDKIAYSTFGEIGWLLGTNKKGKPKNGYISIEYIHRIDPNGLIIKLTTPEFDIKRLWEWRLLFGFRFGL